MAPKFVVATEFTVTTAVLAAATIFDPFSEMATELHHFSGRLFEVQFAPELVETNIEPCDCELDPLTYGCEQATIFLPSDETPPQTQEAFQPPSGAAAA